MRNFAKKITTLPIFLMLLFTLLAPTNVFARVCDPADTTCQAQPTTSTQTTQNSQTNTQPEKQYNIKKTLATNPIFKDIREIVNFLSAGVGIVVVAMIVLGGVQYSLAGDNSAQVTAAKKRIINALIALFAFMFMFAFIQWLIPGGLFG